VIKIYHVSDLHFTAGATIATVPASEDLQARRLLEYIHARHFSRFPIIAPDADSSYLLVTGDLVDDAQEDQYVACAAALTPFAGRLLACPGNHDVARLGDVYDAGSLDRWRKHIQPLCLYQGDQTTRQPAEVHLKNGGTSVRTIGLNSCIYSMTDFGCGEVGDEQRDALLEILNRATYMSWPTLVYFHHRPFALNWPVSKVMALKDGPALMEILDGVIDAACYGHTGTNIELPYGVPLELLQTTLKGTQHLDANASVSTGSYYEITFDGSECKVTAMRTA